MMPGGGRVFGRRGGVGIGERYPCGKFSDCGVHGVRKPTIDVRRGAGKVKHGASQESQLCRLLIGVASDVACRPSARRCPHDHAGSGARLREPGELLL